MGRSVALVMLLWSSMPCHAALEFHSLGVMGRNVALVMLLLSSMPCHAALDFHSGRRKLLSQESNRTEQIVLPLESAQVKLNGTRSSPDSRFI